MGDWGRCAARARVAVAGALVVVCVSAGSAIAGGDSISTIVVPKHLRTHHAYSLFVKGFAAGTAEVWPLFDTRPCATSLKSEYRRSFPPHRTAGLAGPDEVQGQFSAEAKVGRFPKAGTWHLCSYLAPPSSYRTLAKRFVRMRVR
jgi:hypothetical protein